MNMLSLEWKRKLSIIAILLATITASYLLYRAANPPTLDELRTQGVNVKDENAIGVWWMEQKTGTDDHKTFPVSNKIVALRRSRGNQLNTTYGAHFVNPFNNTIWLVVTDVSPESIRLIEEMIGPHEGVKLIYRKAPASWLELKGYEKIISDRLFSLRDKSVMVTRFGKSVNATLEIDILPVTPYSVNILISNLPEIPLSLIVIRRGSYFVKE
jgi:hypothetical protein